MKMDTSLWNKFTDIKVLPTKKKFFGQYLYKVVVKAEGCRIVLNYNTSEVAGAIKRRIADNQELIERYKSSWGGTSFRASLYTDYNTKQLEHYATVREKYGAQIKMRVEEPRLTIYCNDEQTLYDIVNGDHMGYVLEIHRPRNDTDIKSLNNGELLVGYKQKYQYKVMLKDGINKHPNLPQIYDQLMSLGVLIKLPPSCRNLFKIGHQRFWMPSTFFYVMDEQTASYVQLLLPQGMVSGIYKLTRSS
jgi:hypothetical protein